MTPTKIFEITDKDAAILFTNENKEIVLVLPEQDAADPVLPSTYAAAAVAFLFEDQNADLLEELYGRMAQDINAVSEPTTSAEALATAAIDKARMQ